VTRPAHERGHRLATWAANCGFAIVYGQTQDQAGADGLRRPDIRSNSMAQIVLNKIDKTYPGGMKR